MKLMWFIHRPGIMCTKCFLFLEIFMLKSIPLYQKNSFSKYTGLDARRTRRRLTKPDKSRQESSWTIMRAQQTQMNNQNKGGLACSLPLEGPWGVWYSNKWWGGPGSWLHSLLSVLPWADHLTSLNLSLLILKEVTSTCKAVGRILWGHRRQVPSTQRVLKEWQRYP